MIPHLEQQIAFLTACRDHGEDRVEWRAKAPFLDWGVWIRASVSTPHWDRRNAYEVRTCPRKHVIPRAEVPMPLRVEPRKNSLYYLVNVQGETGYDQIQWQRDDVDLRWFKSGICYATPEDAAAAARAMLAREE